jgi:hypothetical protein
VIDPYSLRIARYRRRMTLAAQAFALILMTTLTAGRSPACAVLVGPFAGVEIVKLVLATPGVSRDASLSSEKSVWVNVAGQKSGGFIRTDQATSGQTIDGDWLLAVPLDTAKPEGAFVALVYRSTGGAPEYIAAVDSKRGLLRVSVHDGHLFVTAPLFSKKDLACCPSTEVVERILYSPGTDGLIVVTRQRIKRARPAPTQAARP